MLEESKNYNDYEYILPYFYQRYPEYKKFMDNYEKFKILDCGLFEGEIPTIPELLEIIKESKPNTFIVPDTWNDWVTTLKDAKYWVGLKKAGILPLDLNLMVVLQGKTFGEIEILYQQCIDLGYKYFAFNHSSIAYQNEIKEGSELEKAKQGRIELIKRLYNKNIITEYHYIHLLGASDITEFSFYKEELPRVISSIDTSSPIVKGIEEGLYTEKNMKIKSKNKLEKYFEINLDPHQKDRILQNINQFKEIVNNMNEQEEISINDIITGIINMTQPQPDYTGGEYKSLYEYLGKAAGKELGNQVYNFAKFNKIKSRNKQVNQGGYNGSVMCYPVNFLTYYFDLRKQYEQYKQYFG
jgi:hypothetical protein